MLTFLFLDFILICKYPIISDFCEVSNFKSVFVKINCLNILTCKSFKLGFTCSIMGNLLKSLQEKYVS